MSQVKLSSLYHIRFPCSLRKKLKEILAPHTVICSNSTGTIIIIIIIHIGVRAYLNRESASGDSNAYVPQ